MSDNPQRPWPHYRAHKVVQAAPIVGISRNKTITVDPSNGANPAEVFEPTEPGMKARCVVGDYAMIYRDGYRSVCPKKEFEDGYTREPTP
jgi:hypothetical protein